MKLEEKLNILAQLALRAHVYFDLWWIYQGAPTRLKYLPSMNRYSEFFRFDIHAQEIANTMYLCQIFENRRDTINIKNVIKEAKTRKLSTEHIAAAEKALQEALPIRDKLVIIRNNLFAHRSLSLDYSGTFKKARLTPNETRRLSELGLEAINSLLTALKQQVHWFTPLPGNDLEQLLREIKPNSKPDA